MKVSVIIPCYNVAKYIEECLYSVYNQTYRNLEVIVVDNSSSDDTLVVVKRLKLEKYNDLIIIEESKKGACAARNKGLSLANGEWIQFLDADDIIYPEKIANQIMLIQGLSNLDFIAGAFFKKNLTSNELKKVIPSSKNPLLDVYVREYGNTCSNLWRKNTLDALTGWNENLSSSQETELMFRLLANHGLSIIDEVPLTQINERESGQISQSNPIIRLSNFIEVRLKMIEELKRNKENEFQKFKSDFETFLLSSILILNKYNFSLALNFYRKYSFDLSDIQEKYGVSKTHINLLKLLGPRFTLYMLSKK